MQIILSLLSSTPYVELPSGVLGWLAWIFLFFVEIAVVWLSPGSALVRSGSVSLREASKGGKKLWRWALFPVLLLSTPFLTLFFGIRFSQENALPIPGMPVEYAMPALMFLSAIPWTLAAGILGSVPAVILAGLTGLFLSFWETHSSFTVLEYCGLALTFSLLIRQNYRTWLYQVFRHPIGAALCLAILYAPVYVLTAFFEVTGSLAVRTDYSLTQTWPLMVMRGVELIIAGLFTEAIYLSKVDFWYRPQILVPSPAESKIELRFFYGTAPLVLLLFTTLTIGDWIVAGNAARRMVREQLAGASKVITQSLPYFLESGQNLIKNMAGEELLNVPREQLPAELEKRLRSVPFFRMLYVFDGSGLVAGYPPANSEDIHLSDQETAGIKLALKGVLIQSYTVRPLPGENSTQVSFLGAIKNGQGQVIGVLLGRTDFNTNPFTQPAIEALNSAVQTGGIGTILDENHLILYDTVQSPVMNTYSIILPEVDAFFDQASPQGTRQLVYTGTMIGRPWRVIMAIPAEVAQQMALRIAIPLLIILLLLSLVAFISLRLGLSTVTGSLQNLAHEATLISQGQLDHSLPVQGVDEVGEFSRAFEQMRISLKTRLEELNRLLLVSQGVASNLDVRYAILPILQAALGEGAMLARVVLIKEVTLDTRREDLQLVTFGQGPTSEQNSYLDEQIFEMMRQQDLLTIPNTSRVRRLNFQSGTTPPAGLVALSLRQESTYYGVLWIGYEQPHTFTEEEIRFLSTLAGQASVAATNSQLYATAEIGRQRLEAVLASTPEPVLVIDEKLRLLLLNPAALQIPGLVLSPIPGHPIDQVIGQDRILELVSLNPLDHLVSREVKLSTDRIYFISVAPVTAEGRSVGRICIMRDITHYKELDTLKSDFVSTVSHDLRSPLTLMRGYTTMLQMVGELNEQQKGYVAKIIAGVESMSRLVGNLLDLGRIEAGIGLKIEKISAVDILDKVIGSLQPQAGQKNIDLGQDKIATRAVQRAITLFADPALLEQALYNLVENAIKYTPVGGKVKVDLQVRSTSAIFEVKDNGIGIAPLDLPHMFEKFYRSGRREAYQQRGTGLGLAIVKSIAELHNGKVWVESQLGKGSTFYIEIPFEQPSK